MAEVTLKSRVIEVGEMQVFDTEAIKDEPMYRKASEEFVKFDSEPGPITKAFMRALPDDWKPIPSTAVWGWDVYDCRTHMLMDGWYPAIPGFHLDSVPRGEDGQPIPGSGKAECILTSFGRTPTLILDGDLVFEYDPDGANIYKQLDGAVEGWLDSGDAELVETKPGVLYYVDSETVHAAQANYEGFGWRWFGRVTRGVPDTKVANEIRKQVQAYVSTNAGW